MGSGETARLHRTETDVELRTIGFRLREIQRLLSMRVVQENRRLEADGLTPVTEADFFKQEIDEERISRQGVSRQAERLGGLELGAGVRLTLVDGTVIAGTAGPIEFVPSERLRLELRPRDDSAVRFEVRTAFDETGWAPVTVRRYEIGDNDWDVLGVVREVSTP
ncbi:MULTISPECIES: hypothetical protein [unclassified Haladaptatus]|uniref:hypothetical protein n=1 Tax=unclassified Haladaptatus TaxID=2622732 RepID=UPI0023E792A8|nr:MULTISPECIES: hypothetical protein [unclassified Haladaptatus]